MSQLHLMLVQTEITVLLALLIFIEAQRRVWDIPLGWPYFPRSLLRGVGKQLQIATGWVIHNIASPGVCFIAIACGVLCANHLTGQLVGTIVMRPLPLIDAAPGVDFALAALVFDRGGYRRWQAAMTMPLLPRALLVFGLGFTWPLVVGRQAR